MSFYQPTAEATTTEWIVALKYMNNVEEIKKSMQTIHLQHANSESSNKWQILFSSIVSSICHRLVVSLSHAHTASEPLGQSHRQQFYFYFDEKLECDERAKQILYHIKIRLTSNWIRYLSTEFIPSATGTRMKAMKHLRQITIFRNDFRRFSPTDR